jgi:hypothetical protein
MVVSYSTVVVLTRGVVFMFRTSYVILGTRTTRFSVSARLFRLTDCINVWCVFLLRAPYFISVCHTTQNRVQRTIISYTVLYHRM